MTSTNEHSKPKVLRGPEAAKDWADQLARLESGHYWPTVLGVLKKGCKQLPLRILMRPCASDQFSAERKKELDSVKDRYDALIRRLKSVSDAFDDGPDEFLRSAARSQRSVAAELEKRKSSIAKDQSIRNTRTLFSIAPLWFYCRAATGGKVTYQEVANLIDAAREAWEAETDNPRDPTLDGHDVRMALSRFQKRDHNNFVFLKTMMEQYVADCPDGKLFGQWFCKWSQKLPIKVRLGLVSDFTLYRARPRHRGDTPCQKS